MDLTLYCKAMELGKEEDKLKEARMSGPFHQPGSHLLGLSDDHLLSIFGFSVDLQLQTLSSLLRRKSRGYSGVPEPVLEDVSAAEDEESFKTAFPNSHAQMFREKRMRRTITRPARELKAYMLICQRFHEVIANPAYEVFLYSGMVVCLKTHYLLYNSGIDFDDEWERCKIFDDLFSDRNLEMLQSSAASSSTRTSTPGAALPICIQIDNKNQSRGFWYGKREEDLSTTECLFYHNSAKEGVPYALHCVSDKDRAAFLRALRVGDRKMPFRMEKCVADPRLDFLILELEGTPQSPIVQYLELIKWVDSKLLQLRSVLINPSDPLPAPFHQCLEWCFDTAEELDVEGVQYIEPDMDLVLDSIVSWAVTDFEQGCQHYIAYDVLFGTFAYDVLFGTYFRNRRGWDNWHVCSGSSEYFVPFMVMGVDSDRWP